MKKYCVFVFFFLFLINFVSAPFYSYNRFDLGNFLDSVDPSFIILGVVFLVSFALLNFSLSRAFKGNKATAGIISFCLALAISYAVHQTGINYYSFFYDLGFDLNFYLYGLDGLLWFVSFIIFVLFGIKGAFGLGMVFIGVVWILTGFTDFVEAPQFFLKVGVFLLIIGFFINLKFPPKKTLKSR